MACQPFLLKDVHTLTFLSSLVATLFPPPTSGAAYLGCRHNRQGNIEYRAIVMGHVEDEMTGEYDGTTMGQLIAMEVASSRSEALLKLLGAVEDFTENQFQDMKEELE
jgi:hypothetical protein